MNQPRIFIAAVVAPGVPDLPADLSAVVDITGVLWKRTNDDGPAPNCFIPDDPLGIDRLPKVISWPQLVAVRGPLAEYRTPLFLTTTPAA